MSDGFVPGAYRGGERLRRVVDLAATAAGAVALSPVTLCAAALVRWRLGRPVFFTQTRSGLQGGEFKIVKLRTMRAPAFPGEADGPRVTRLGRGLRATSVDELPQLWNVLKGDMALVGPRPTLPEQVLHYSPRQRRRLLVRPGLTGWAQVRARNSVDWPTRIELDLWYLEHRCWALDVRIVALTVLRLLRPSGVTAEGGENPGFPVATSLAAGMPAVADDAHDALDVVEGEPRAAG